jgi:hypothetical protein
LTICIRSRGTFATAVVNLPGIVAAIGPDRFEPREALADLAEDQPGPVAVLDRGGVYDYPHRQPLAVDQGVDLATLHPLAGVVTHLVVVTAPFFRFDRSAVENRGQELASRPIRSRNAICGSAQIASQMPSRWNLRKMW